MTSIVGGPAGPGKSMILNPVLGLLLLLVLDTFWDVFCVRRKMLQSVVIYV